MFLRSDFNNRHFQVVSTVELDSSIWDVKWNLAGTMLAANYKDNSGAKCIGVLKEKKENEWSIVDTIKLG